MLREGLKRVKIMMSFLFLVWSILYMMELVVEVVFHHPIGGDVAL